MTGQEPCEACGRPVDDRFAHRAPSGVGWVHDRCCTQPDCRQLLELVRKATR